MREILFRAKAINRDKGYHRTNYKNGDWVYGLVIRLYDDRFENLPAEMKDLSGVNGIEVNHETIGQFTGLYDTNGVKIFEGDIITNRYFDNGVVSYYDGAFEVNEDGACATFHANFDGDRCEVIGNIYDNPELLEDGENDA